MKSKEHYGAVGQVRNEVIVPTCCNGCVQEGTSPLSSGGLYPVVVTQLEGREKLVIKSHVKRIFS